MFYIEKKRDYYIFYKIEYKITLKNQERLLDINLLYLKKYCQRNNLKWGLFKWKQLHKIFEEKIGRNYTPLIAEVE